MPDLAGLLADLAAESAELDDLIAPLPADAWQTPTPAAGWSVAHQIAHLRWTDDVACRAARNDLADVLSAAAADPAGFVDAAADAGAGEPSEELLASWREGRAALHDALAAVPDGTRLPWFGPPMSAASMATARLMETWAHGQDIADALGVVRIPTERLRHVAYLGVRTFGFAFLTRGLTPPTSEIRVELAGPAGQLWAFGPPDADQHVAGSALDFCLLVTQRRHRSDLGLVAHGPDADAWLDLAQAFAGPPGPGRPPAGTRP